MSEKNNILNLIGNTPLIQIENPDQNENVKIFAKLEGFNPTGSIKDRIALAMVEKAEKDGTLRPGKIIIEPTSGNTGISLAMIAAVKGYKIKIVMPEIMSIEKRKILKAFGADLILVKNSEWRDAAIKFTKQLVKKNSKLVMLNQYENEINPKIHYQTTAKEILKQIGKEKIDYFVAGIGTGGTISGIGKRLKEKFPKIKILGVEPKINGKIEGLKSLKDGYVPPILDFSVIDEIKIVSDKATIKYSKILTEKYGLFMGVSSGAVMSEVFKLSSKIKKGNILTILPDRGEKYLSTL